LQEKRASDIYRMLQHLESFRLSNVNTQHYPEENGKIFFKKSDKDSSYDQIDYSF